MKRPRLILAGATQLTGSLLTPVAAAAKGVRRSMGASPRAVQRVGYSSSHYRDGVFCNTEPMGIVEVAESGGMLRDWIRKGDVGRPAGQVPLTTPDLPETAGEIAATWLGHATVLLEVDGHWVLTDPVWSDRVSPSATVGPRRHHPVPLDLDDLPRLDAVLISHDHYDHLDTATVDALVASQTMPFVVPLGVGAHLRRWGVPDDRVVELDWEQHHRVGGLTFTCTEARHFSGRGLSRNSTLWSSWVVTGEQHRVFFGGDSGWTAEFEEIGRRHGPFDLTLVPIGAYDRRWPEVHLNPEEAARTHEVVGGRVLLPIHWATFDLAFHSWSEPIEWLVREAEARGLALATPRPGERFEAAGELPAGGWWQACARGQQEPRPRRASPARSPAPKS